MSAWAPAGERFERFISPEPNSGCWLWTGVVRRNGYGQFSFRTGVSPLAHRFSYELYVAPIADGLTIDHLCRVRSCVNPDHLQVVSLAENVRRAINHANPGRNRPADLTPFKRTHCKHGHEFTDENTLWHSKPGRPSGVHRSCRTCWIERARQNRLNASMKRKGA